jgi:predicted HicB family RNase H-like nuclease
VPPEVHAELFRKAQEAGADSFDEWFSDKIKESVLRRA